MYTAHCENLSLQITPILTLDNKKCWVLSAPLCQIIAAVPVLLKSLTFVDLAL